MLCRGPWDHSCFPGLQSFSLGNLNLEAPGLQPCTALATWWQETLCLYRWESEQPCKVGGWEPCPEHRWAQRRSKPRKRLVCSGAISSPLQRESGQRAFPLGGSFPSRSQLLVVGLLHPLWCRGIWSWHEVRSSFWAILKDHLQQNTFGHS